MAVVYIAGPFRSPTAWGIEANIQRAEALALKVWLAGAAALCPHANTRNFNGAAPDAVWLKGDLAMLEKCDAVILTPDWQTSPGARAEREHALELGMRVFYDIEDLENWLAVANYLTGRVAERRARPEEEKAEKAEPICTGRGQLVYDAPGMQWVCPCGCGTFVTALEMARYKGRQWRA